MKTQNLILTALLSGTLLVGGCFHDSDEAKAAAQALLDGYAEEEAKKEVSTSDALVKDYIEDESSKTNSANALGDADANIGGEIAVDSFNRSLAKMASRSRSGRAQLTARVVDDIATSDFTVYFISGNGTKIELNVPASNITIRKIASGNTQFVISGVGSGVNYIVEVNVTVDGTAISLQSVAFIPAGQTRSEKTTIDPISTVIAEAVQAQVTDDFFDTGGDTFSQTYISDLRDTLVAVVTEVIASDPNVTLAQFETALNSSEGVTDLVTKLLNNDEVSDSLGTLEVAAKVEANEVPDEIASGDAGQTQARDIIKELFTENDEDDDDPTPQFVIDFFGDEYQKGTLQSIDVIFNAIFSGVIFADGVDFSDISKAGALEAFTNELAAVYGIINSIAALEASDDAADQALLKEQRAQIADFQLFLSIFPVSRKDDWLTLSGNSQLNVPQAITLIFYTLGDYLDNLTSSVTVNGQPVDAVEDWEPDNLFKLYGLIIDRDDPDFVEVEGQFDEYANLEVNWLELHAGQVWVGDLQDHVDVLSVFTCVDAFPMELFNITKVSLSYTTSTGTSMDIDLRKESEFPRYNENGDLFLDDMANQDGHVDTCYAVNPWGESDLLALQSAFTNTDGSPRWDDIWNELYDKDNIITDFAIGTSNYVIAVEYEKDGVVQTAYSNNFDKTIITGLQDLTARFTSPLGLPPFPSNSASSAEWDAFNIAQDNFAITTFTTGDLVTFAWDAPAELAAALTAINSDGLNVVAVYNLDVGRDVCGDDPATPEVEEYCRWMPIYSTWQDNTQITGTTFELPATAKAMLTELAISDTPYQVSLGIDFIDTETGEYFGNGGWTQAPFRVGAELDLSATFDITGTVIGAPDTNFTDDQGVPYPLSMYKVAVVQESCSEDTDAEPFTDTYFDEELGQFVQVEYFPWICSSTSLAISTVSDTGTYLLQPTLQALMSNSQDSWIDIRLFIDANDNDLIDQGTEANNYFWEPQFWSQDGVNFNSWGGVLRISHFGACDENGCGDFSEEIIIPGASYAGPSFNLTMAGPGGGNGDDDDDFAPNINAFFLPGATVGEHALEWNLGPTINASDVTGFTVILFEVDPSAQEPEPLAAVLVNVPATMGTININQMLNPSGDIVDITAQVLSDVSAEEGLTIQVLTALDATKTYVWIVEAFNAEDDVIGESNDIVIIPQPAN